MIALSALGWDASRDLELRTAFGRSASAARVVGLSRGSYSLESDTVSGEARLTGAFARAARRPTDYPTVGDWVVIGGADGLRITSLLPRRNLISRKAAGTPTIEQPLAANVDRVLVVFSLEGGSARPPRALERYLALVRGSGAVPSILLNKADLLMSSGDEQMCDVAERTSAGAPGAEVLVTSAVTGVGMDALRSRLQPGTTALLLGPSGSGKSSLANELLGRESQSVGEVRASDLRGRHTTVRRELMLLEGGGLLIDSPGLREVGPWVEPDAIEEVFPEIAELAQGCRFRDCTHSGEPGCAVQSACADGTLDIRRLAAYIELSRENRERARSVIDRARRSREPNRRKRLRP
ncbi:MAG TPA: ribosome small subunit-dependent GTPase A [Spirochaetia bacterium]|nr:ribosome small subunit-dependent GTPase A [Spirochaetia bacterium]